MNNLTFSCLSACREFTLCQNELAHVLAETIGIQPEDLFYTWVLHKVNQSGTIRSTNWQYFFHGLGCNIENIVDRRLLPMSFGPGGRLDTFVSNSVLQFIMTSKSPWKEFPELRIHLAKHEPPHNKYSGSLQRMSKLWDQLQESGLIEIADPQLISLVEQYTTVLPNGENIVSLPNNLDERIHWDSYVRNRWIISKHGWQVLEMENC